ncbi:DUF1990 family protein [Marisediminicola sp. LYQ85]|uniref:DUF1990 family protein n=1 Tax=Marisediminicola sp. LYQ85 TaxID=3391062 RepID=UPI00398386DF
MTESEAVPLWRRPVTYGAIGGTKAPDLAVFPPAGFRSIVKRQRIGHGDNRFAWASAQTMTWGIQRLSGFRVEVSDAPAAVTDATYTPVGFDTAGIPTVSATVAEADEDTFNADGASYLVPGDTATLTIRFLLIPVTANVRVVYVVNEPDRVGFAYGTLAGHPESGEEAFIVERGDDGSVWLAISAFSRPSTWYWRALFIPLRIAQALYTRRYLRVLAGPTD